MSTIIKVVNLEVGLPTVEQARARLIGELQIARKDGVKVIKFIHGYGSTGVGGDLRLALQATLRQMMDRCEFHSCIFGENWRTSDDHTWALLKRMPELKQDRDMGKGNRGITVVAL
jgi:hypothetical protein